jgi:hypothetical protein
MYLWSMTFQHNISDSATIGAPSASMSDQHLRRARGSEWVEAWEEEPGAIRTATSLSLSLPSPTRRDHHSLQVVSSPSLSLRTP